MESDADRWDMRYRAATVPTQLHPHPLVQMVAAETSTWRDLRCLDVACGLADDAIYLAQHGAAVTGIDVSAVALELVERRSGHHDVAVATRLVDTKSDPFPLGPWDLITCLHYLDRELLATIGDHLAPAGRIAVAIATRTNLERHDRPSARFLLEPGELATLIPNSLQIEHEDEAWRESGTHEAWLIARAPAP